MRKQSWHLNRRTFLMGSGASLGRPWLECMADSATLTSESRPARFCALYFGFGVSVAENGSEHAHWRWFPNGEGKDYRFNESLKPLESLRDQLTILGGLSHPRGRKMGGHDTADTFLTGALMDSRSLANSVSVDQVIANRWDGQTRFPSLVMSTDGGVGAPTRSSTLSYNQQGPPIPALNEPRRIFARLFGAGDDESQAENRRLLSAASMLDGLLEDSKSLMRRLGQADQVKLDEYFESVRETERRVANSQKWFEIPRRTLNDDERKLLDLDADEEAPIRYMQTMYDLIYLAFLTDSTRVATYQITNMADASSRAVKFPQLLGFTENLHKTAHGWNTLAMVLVHPNFLYLRRFVDSEPQTIDDHQLATRLSYFLWSTMPDDELLAAADQPRLHESDELLRQVDRLLADERSLRWMTRFVDQWLKLDRLNNVAADIDVYPDFDPAVKADMRAETQMFFRAVVNEDLGAMNLIRSDFSVLNERMARHYGIANIWGREFRRVPISTDSHRGGILTNASILMANSTGTKSHPVLRAVWVRDRLLNDPPGSPPADVPKLDQIDPKFAELPIRKQMEIHRDSDSCRQCHRGLDPWGLALENFDAVGLWHENIDASTELPGGVHLRGINDLQGYLLQSQADRFARSLVVRLISYALGRQVDINDRPMIEQLTVAFTKNDCRIKGLVREIVQTSEFQNY